MSTAARGPEGPQNPLVELRVEHAPPKGYRVVRFLGPYRGIITHWLRGRGVACPGREKCKAETHRLRNTWKGYAPAEYWRDKPHEDWCPCVWEVTENLLTFLEGRTLRGEVWKFWQEVIKADVYKHVGECIDENNADCLRPAFNVEPGVWRCYHTKEIEWDVEPVMPPRELMLPSAGPRPIILPSPKKGEPSQEPVRETVAERRAKLLSAQADNHKSNGQSLNGKGCH